MFVRLVLLACTTTLSISTYKLCKTWPLEFQGNKLMSFEITWMHGGLVIMAMRDNGAVERVLSGNIDTVLEYQDMIIVLPVRKVEPEGSRDILERRL